MKEVEEGLPATLYGDEIRLKQLLINLIKYFFKKSKSEAIKLKANYDGATKQLFVMISDDGSNIDHAEVNNQLYGSEPSHVDTYLLSLTICAKIIAKLNGSISIRWKDTKAGSVLQFVLKILPSPSAPPDLREEIKTNWSKLIE